MRPARSIPLMTCLTVAGVDTCISAAGSPHMPRMASAHWNEVRLAPESGKTTEAFFGSALHIPCTAPISPM